MPDRLFEDFMKEQCPRICFPTIVTEGELFQIVVNGSSPYKCLMSPQEPPFQQRGYSMDIGQDVFTFEAIGFIFNSVIVTQAFYPSVTFPAIADNCCPFFNVVQEEVLDAPLRGIRNLCQSNSAGGAESLFKSHNNKNLAIGSTTTLSRFFTPNKCLINFNNPAQFFPPRNYHQSPEFVEPAPGGLVAAKAQNSLQAKGTHPGFLSNSPPDCSKPRNQRFSGPMENCASSGGHLLLA